MSPLVRTRICICVYEATFQKEYQWWKKCMNGCLTKAARPQPVFVFHCRCQGKTSSQIHSIMLNLTGTHVRPSPTDALPNTAAVNVSLCCQVFNVGPKFTHSGQTEINTRVHRAYKKVRKEVAMRGASGTDKMN